ncbi:hypothetical protein Q4Q34_01815 [Flavivirga abyssicola]|uniref:hypothetical protein n=1 Tax=Flavivirga abyssicola TaxID=3063533 RepID=UPI0026DEAAC7|nr:hypothetical protein [Flavivirga sp. MEBiC07777]WVK13777.1 hypothetical protein Q4Q34_01815 [Flavivirga sp. MEBiC07777]
MHSIKKYLLLLVVLLLPLGFHTINCQENDPSVIKSIDVGYTISKVRIAKSYKETYIVASSYEGTILGVSYTGDVLWKNALSGFMNHDIWCEDITGNGKDEILVANANGSVYCLDNKGVLLWEFKKNDAPMYAITAIKKGKDTYVVAGGYDKSMYYLSASGDLVKEMSSYTYSVDSPWQPYSKPIPDYNCHLSNFIRKVKKANGEEVLAVQGVVHTMAVQARGSLYLFNPLEEKPFKIIDLKGRRPLGELRCVDIDNDGNDEILAGSSSMIHDTSFLKVDLDTEKQGLFKISDIDKGIDKFGYRVVQPELIVEQGESKYFVLLGARILILPLDFDKSELQILSTKYSYNDMWKDSVTGHIILASAQSGGSNIHIINPKKSNWKKAYEHLEPKGKISTILSNTKKIRNSLNNYKAPESQKESQHVYLMAENIPKSMKSWVQNLQANYGNPVFLNSAGSDKEDWDRSGIKNERYRKRRDGRMKYILSQDEIVDKISSRFKNAPGIAYWGGHGNDPYMYQLSTNKKILDQANGKKTVMIFPELEDHSENFAYVMDDYFYPLAEHAQKKNGQIFVRTKHCFWQGNVYLPMWSKLLSGEYSDVFIPAMEETTDKSMDLSLAGRLGIWTSGATDSWGTRCARDNPSLDRLRQHSHQMLPNHFLRNMVFHVAYGAQYLHNFPVDQKHMSLLWELVAKGALYVPKRSEILSFSPVHLSMLNPDEYYMEESSNSKWTTFYNEEHIKNNPRVFSRLNGSWPGAPVTEWDFSNYASGVKDRRTNFIAPYNNGLVLITPPQKGKFADKDAKRKPLVQNLHPIYKNIMKEYYTNGRNYYSKDGKQSYSPETYYKVIKKDIESSRKLLPITVTGEVGWVVAHTSPKHLRLTLVENGYLNPSNKAATVSFNTISPIKVTDVLSHETFDVTNGKVTINIPLGAFKFIDIELAKPL